jgi:hypothetical protein
MEFIEGASPRVPICTAPQCVGTWTLPWRVRSGCQAPRQDERCSWRSLRENSPNTNMALRGHVLRGVCRLSPSRAGKAGVAASRQRTTPRSGSQTCCLLWQHAFCKGKNQLARGDVRCHSTFRWLPRTPYRSTFVRGLAHVPPRSAAKH